MPVSAAGHALPSEFVGSNGLVTHATDGTAAICSSKGKISAELAGSTALPVAGDHTMLALAPEADASRSAFPIVPRSSVAVVDSVSGKSNESFNDPPKDTPMTTIAIRATK